MCVTAREVGLMIGGAGMPEAWEVWEDGGFHVGERPPAERRDREDPRWVPEYDCEGYLLGECGMCPHERECWGEADACER